MRSHLSRAQYITSYVTMQLHAVYSSFGGLQAKLQQMKVVLDGENLVGSRKNSCSWHIATNWRHMTKLLIQHFRCTALRIIVSRPKLSFVYCTEKASGWFFRHEMSDLIDELPEKDVRLTLAEGTLCSIHIIYALYLFTFQR